MTPSTRHRRILKRLVKLDGMMHGQGRLFLLNGELYEGSFVRDVRHGQGVLSIQIARLYKVSLRKVESMTGN